MNEQNLDDLSNEELRNKLEQAQNQLKEKVGKGLEA